MKNYLLTNAEALTDKHILFDSDAIISLENYSVFDFYDELTSIGATFCIIHDVLIELMNTNNSKLRAKRGSMLGERSFFELHRRVDTVALARSIQEKLSSIDVYPSPTDLYIAGTAASYKDLLILTANIKDFPDPLFKRISYVIFNNDKSNKLLTFLSVDRKQIKA